MDRRTWTIVLCIVLGSVALTVGFLRSCSPSSFLDVDFTQDAATRSFRTTSTLFEAYTKGQNVGGLPVHLSSNTNADASDEANGVDLFELISKVEGESGEDSVTEAVANVQIGRAAMTTRREARRATARTQKGRTKNTIVEPAKFGLRDDLFQVPFVANRDERLLELHPEGEQFDLSTNENNVADDFDVNHGTVNVHIVCSSAVQFDLVLALAGSIMLPPSLQKDEILQNEDIEVAIRQIPRTGVNLTIIDATDAAVTAESRSDNAEFDMFRILMLKEAKRLPIQVVKTAAIPVDTPDVLFLASCLDDVLSLRSGIRRALIGNTKIQCVIRHPLLWDSSHHKEDMSKIGTLAGSYISTGKWSFVVSSKDDLNHIHTVFPKLFGFSTLTADRISIFNPIFPRTTVRTISVAPDEAVAAIGADFVRPLNFRRELYEHITTRYIETEPNIAMQLLDFIGGSGKVGRYVIPDSVPHDRISVAHNVPLHTYFERIAKSKLIIPFPTPEENRELAMRMSDMVATTALSVSRPLLLGKSTYTNFFQSRIPSDIVIIAEDQDLDPIEASLLPALKAYVRADTDEIYTAKQDLWKSYISKAEMEHDRIMESNWECMNNIIGKFLL
ncbi:hypothetical protein V1525DRAFT_9581 [Lipomyces kononenkoae]|uniref:Uncharacterized protein n=1 Tax=Lipomyces kononenkoae TaxID=34357 RepID=A0ACC3TCL5_LIPKO